MRLRIILTGTLLVLAAGGALAFQSCGAFGKKKKNDTSAPQGATPATATSPPDVTQPFALAIATGGVNVPAGALPPGAKMTLSGADQPEKFKGDATSAGQPVALVATDAKGAGIPKASAAMSVNLEVSEAPSLYAVDKTAANLCAYGLGTDGVLRIWRSAVLAFDGAAKTVTFPAVWLGVFQPLYCGTAPVPGAEEVNAAGTDATPDGAAPLATCDLTAVPDSGHCWSYAGAMYDQAGALDDVKASCTKAKGTYGTAPCTTAGALGVCAYSYGTTAEFAWTYYTPSGSTPTPAASLQSACEQGKGKFFAAGAYTPTPSSAQTPYTGTAAATATGAGAAAIPNAAAAGTCGTTGNSCAVATNGTCTQYVGEAAQTANTADTCAAQSGTFAAAVCTTAQRLGCCAGTSQTSGASQIDIVLYPSASYDANTAQAFCAAEHGTWIAP